MYVVNLFPSQASRWKEVFFIIMAVSQMTLLLHYKYIVDNQQF